MSKEEYSGSANDIDESIDPQPVKSKPWWKLGGKDYSFVSINSGYTKAAISTSSSDTKLDIPASAPRTLGTNVYETEDTKDIYKPIEKYEGRHRFDPSLKWDPAEEKALIRTVSLNYPPIHINWI